MSGGGFGVGNFCLGKGISLRSEFGLGKKKLIKAKGNK